MLKNKHTSIQELTPLFILFRNTPISIFDTISIPYCVLGSEVAVSIHFDVLIHRTASCRLSYELQIHSLHHDVEIADQI